MKKSVQFFPALYDAVNLQKHYNQTFTNNQNVSIKRCFYAGIVGIVMSIMSTDTLKAQLNSYPATIDFKAAKPDYITLPSGVSYDGTVTDCASTVTGGIKQTSSGKTWTLLATKCARIIYKIKEPSTARGYTITNDKNSVTKTTKGANNSCITDTIDINYNGSAGNITISFAGGSGGSGQAIYALTIYDAVVLPLTFSNFKASQQGSGISINWSVASEVNISKYVIEKSTDGTSFNEAGFVEAKKSGSYTWQDVSVAATDNFYRIKAVENTGRFLYTGMLKMSIANGKPGVVVAPNPVKDNRFNLQLKSLVEGSYNAGIYNSIGQKIYNTVIAHTGGSASQIIQLPSVGKGVYTLLLTGKNTSISKLIIIE